MKHYNDTAFLGFQQKTNILQRDEGFYNFYYKIIIIYTHTLDVWL